MTRLSISAAAGVLAACGLLVWADANPDKVLTGSAAFATVLTEKPGVFRKLTPADLPPPFATSSATAFPRVAARPDGVCPKHPLASASTSMPRGCEFPAP